MNDMPAEAARIEMIVGLGNPGRKYAATRHNIGFMVLDALALRLAAAPWREERLAATTAVRIEGRSLLLVKPMTFMNLSGQAVRAYAGRDRIMPDSILVVSDDLDLPFGRLRLRPGGSTGGHNGLKSIASEIGTQDFPRLRAGISRPLDGDPIDWVLAPFSPAEAGDLPRLRDVACDAVLAAVTAGLIPAMNLFNGRASVLEPEAPAPSPRNRLSDAAPTEVQRA